MDDDVSDDDEAELDDYYDRFVCRMSPHRAVRWLQAQSKGLQWTGRVLRVSYTPSSTDLNSYDFGARRNTYEPPSLPSSIPARCKIRRGVHRLR